MDSFGRMMSMMWCAMQTKTWQKIPKLAKQGFCFSPNTFCNWSRLLRLLVQPWQNLDGQDKIGRMAGGGQCARADRSLVDWAAIPQKALNKTMFSIKESRSIQSFHWKGWNIETSNTYQPRQQLNCWKWREKAKAKQTKPCRWAERKP